MLEMLDVIEPNSIDAIVTDGFTGNVFLKTTEGLGKFVKKSLNEIKPSMIENINSKYLKGDKKLASAIANAFNKK